MTQYDPLDQFDDVNIYDESDLVKGGLAGESNEPIEQLANRTEWIANRLGGYKDVKEISSSGNITADYSNMLISVLASANVTVNVAALNTFKKGTRLVFVATLTGPTPFWLNVITTEGIANGSELRNNIWLYDGEMIELVAGSSIWHWTYSKGNFDKIGEVELKRFRPKNSFVGDGTSNESRIVYPRLWEVIASTAVSDASWVSGANRYRQQFSTGNGSTTFRRADYRAMFFRALDLGRGVSLGRLDANAGGFEDNAIQEHFHNSGIKGNSQDYSDGNAAPNNIGTQSPAGSFIIKTGGAIDTAGTSIGKTETRPKNIGFTPYIFY